MRILSTRNHRIDLAATAISRSVWQHPLVPLPPRLIETIFLVSSVKSLSRYFILALEVTTKTAAANASLPDLIPQRLTSCDSCGVSTNITTMLSPTGDEKMRQTMTVIISILICSMGLVIWHCLGDRRPQSSRKQKKTAGICHIETLPVELLTNILENLAPDEVQSYIDNKSLHRDKQAQNDLRNVCLVSKQMVQVARQYLYRAVIVSNVDVLAYLLRTLDENQDLGEQVKRLVLAVPFILEDAHYRKPNVGILESSSNCRKTSAAAARASDTSDYRLLVAEMAEVDPPQNLSLSAPWLIDWVWGMECEVLGLMYFGILLQTKNLESLCIDMICSAHRHGLSPFSTFLSKIAQVTTTCTSEPRPPFLAKLHELQFLAYNSERQRPYSANFLKRLLGLSTPRVLRSFHDDGRWFHSDSLPQSLFPSKSSRRYPRHAPLARPLQNPDTVY